MAEAGDEIGLMWCCNFPNFIYTKKSDSKKKYMPFLRIILIATIKEYNYPTPQACRAVRNVGSLVEPIHHSWDWKQLRWIQSHSWWMGSTCDPTFLTTRRLRRRVVLYYTYVRGRKGFFIVIHIQTTSAFTSAFIATFCNRCFFKTEKRDRKCCAQFPVPHFTTRQFLGISPYRCLLNKFFLQVCS